MGHLPRDAYSRVDFFQFADQVGQAGPVFLADPYGRSLYEKFNSGPEGKASAFRDILDDAAAGKSRFASDDATRSIWGSFVRTADKYDRPGTFSAMTGFEWTSGPSGNNRHRVVVFADGADKTGQVLPYSTFDSQDPEDLWRYLANYEEKTGGRAIAIPHNGNLSNGQMFNETDASGNPMTSRSW